MTFKPAVWFPIAVGLSALNLVGVGFAAATAESWHAATHAVLALGFGLWAQRLRSRTSAPGQVPSSELAARLESLEADLMRQRQELTETQERLDFTERVLAQKVDQPRLGPRD